MARYGNAGVSSLLSSARAAQKRKLAYQDDISAYEFDLSAKTPEDFAKRNAYIADRIKKATDPSEQLSLQRTQTSAYRAFNTAQISRASMAVSYGDISKRDKYSQMYGLLEQAIQNGDDNLAQSIQSQMTSLRVQIQNEEQAAANKASGQALSANAAGVDTAIKQSSQLEAKYREALALGKISTVEFNDKMGQLVQQRESILTNAANGAYGDVSESKLQSYSDKLTALTSSPEYLTYTNSLQEKGLRKDANGNFISERPQYLSYNETTGLYAPANRPIADQTPVLDANGKPMLDQNGQPIVQSTFTNGKKGDQFLVDRQLNNKDANGFTQTFGFGLNNNDEKSLKAGDSYYIDRVSGKKIYVQQNSDGTYTHAVETKPGENPFKAAPIDLAPGEATPLAKSFVSAGGVLGRTAADAVSAISNIGNTGRLQKEAAARKAKAEAEALAAAQRATEASRAALAAIPRAVPIVAPTVNRSNKVIGGVGAPAVPAATLQSQNMVGSADFAKRYGLPGGVPSTPTPAPNPNPTQSFLKKIPLIGRFF